MIHFLFHSSPRRAMASRLVQTRMEKKRYQATVKRAPDSLMPMLASQLFSVTAWGRRREEKINSGNFQPPLPLTKGEANAGQG